MMWNYYDSDKSKSMRTFCVWKRDSNKNNERPALVLLLIKVPCESIFLECVCAMFESLDKT